MSIEIAYLVSGALVFVGAIVAGVNVRGNREWKLVLV